MIIVDEFIMSSDEEIKQHSTTYSFSCSGRNEVNYIGGVTNDRCSSYILFWNIETTYTNYNAVTTLPLMPILHQPLFTKCCLAIIHALLYFCTNFGMTCLR